MIIDFSRHLTPSCLSDIRVRGVAVYCIVSLVLTYTRGGRLVIIIPHNSTALFFFFFLSHQPACCKLFTLEITKCISVDWWMRNIFAFIFIFSYFLPKISLNFYLLHWFYVWDTFQYDASIISNNFRIKQFEDLSRKRDINLLVVQY